MKNKERHFHSCSIDAPGFICVHLRLSAARLLLTLVGVHRRSSAAQGVLSSICVYLRLSAARLLLTLVGVHRRLICVEAA
jgi:hypothetical protein